MSTAKKASAKTKKAATSAASARAKTPAAASSGAAPRQISTTTMGLVLGALLTGGVVATALQSPGKTAGSGDLDTQMEAYIRANPELILTVVREYSMNKEKQSKAQAINLVKANDGNTVFGNPDGDVTIYEFSDYNCGYCKRAFADLMNVVREDGNIRVVVKEFPILSESSYDAAVMSLAAAEAGRYEEFHSALMQWQGAIDTTVLDQITADLGLDIAALDELKARKDIQDTLANNRTLAEGINVTGTPAFIIGDEFVPGFIQGDQIKELVAQARGGNS